jgi:hypothetical protein
MPGYQARRRYVGEWAHGVRIFHNFFSNPPFLLCSPFVRPVAESKRFRKRQTSLIIALVLASDIIDLLL